MKKLYTLFLALLGLSESSYAHCLHEVEIASMPDQISESEFVGYDLRSDLIKLSELTEEYEQATEQDRLLIKAEATIVVQRIKDMGCGGVLRAALVCAICTDGNNKGVAL